MVLPLPLFLILTLESTRAFELSSLRICASGESAQAANLRKHRVDFADAATVFEDDRALTVANDDPEEEHYITIGMDALGRVLVVIYTMRGERIRIISARQATRRERAEHEQGL